MPEPGATAGLLANIGLLVNILIFSLTLVVASSSVVWSDESALMLLAGSIDKGGDNGLLGSRGISSCNRLRVYGDEPRLKLDMLAWDETACCLACLSKADLT